MSFYKEHFLLIGCAIILWTNVYASGTLAATKSEQIYNFAQYVKWSKQTKTITFCVAGNKTVFNQLNSKIKSVKMIKSRPLIVKTVARQSQLPICSILYVDKGSALMPAAKKLQEVLTVSNQNSFAKNVGIIEFIAKNQFCINHIRAKKQGVSLQGKLLRLAKKCQ
ncbi:YfiR family protein [Candidatus Albibeggiatoa sp. nov. BB20]|uniref:YfiR family protein n=1 Tax=Candidatus Albibeggiatoa sp. nov. BB20 TaxID=3162723 RepID=UPI0033654AB7